MNIVEHGVGRMFALSKSSAKAQTIEQLKDFYKLNGPFIHFFSTK